MELSREEQVAVLEREARKLLIDKNKATAQVKVFSMRRAQIAVAMKDAEKHHVAEQKKRKEEMGKLLNQIFKAETEERAARDAVEQKVAEVHKSYEDIQADQMKQFESRTAS